MVAQITEQVRVHDTLDEAPLAVDDLESILVPPREHGPQLDARHRLEHDERAAGSRGTNLLDVDLDVAEHVLGARCALVVEDHGVVHLPDSLSSFERCSTTRRPEHSMLEQRGHAIEIAGVEPLGVRDNQRAYGLPSTHRRTVACAAVPYRAVIFDLGGVVLPSPMAAFRAYEERTGLPHRFISEVIVASEDHGAWSRLERGEINLPDFAAAFEAECAAAGGVIVAADMFDLMQGGDGPHPEMLGAIARIRDEGLKTAALTNNWSADDGGAMTDRVPELARAFDVIVESSIEGLRKPDPRIYELTCERLDVQPSDAVFLDDLGVNLKAARALGMTTIKVVDTAIAVAELEAALGFALGPAAH